MPKSENANITYPIQGKHNGSLKFSYLPCINYAICNNNIPTCIECTLTNSDKELWKDITISIAGSNIISCDVHLEQILSKESTSIKELTIKPTLDKLIEQTEAITTVFKLSITIKDTCVFEKEFPIYLMAFDQWCGSTVMPELLATFVTPNHPLISRVINNAAKHLKQFSGSPSFDEYQSQNPNRVRMQVAAIYEALREESLIYVSTPASFEDVGQRIRLADKVLNEKLGTCLDLTLLFASCLEAVQINPILILKNGHAFLGAWLIDSIYSSTIGDDVSFLIKESSDGINEMVFVESTCLTSASALSFEKAAEVARHSLFDENDFEFFIDIARCRMDRIRPLPQRINKDGTWIIINTGDTHSLSTKEVHEYHHYDLKIEDDGKEATKQQIWERKLLDFTLRNNLLNMRIGKKVIPFISYHIDKLEDYIQSGEHYQLLPNPAGKDMPIEASGIYNSMLYKQDLEEFITKELSDKKLHSYLKEAELIEGVKHLYRASRTAIEENGANSLFLVLGILKWFETPQSERPRYAPLLLLPVEIVRNGGCKKYVLRARDEEIILNITLVELLKQKYEIVMPGLSPLPTDESGVDVKKIFSIIRTCIMHEKGWDVIEECMLGLFSFNKFVMWNDIHNNAEKLKENPVIQSLINNQLAWQDNAESIDARELDSITSPKDYALPVPADSSQLEAILEAGEGKSFILHGPPGTGKSQTITNIIANALFHGKRVLFVAEKMAALSVVQNRLSHIGLDPFCLELHSNKINKKHFLQQMDQALNITRLTSPQEFSEKAEILFKQRKGLIAYMESLHQTHTCGYSLYECISNYLSITESELEHEWNDTSGLTKNNIEQYQEEIQELDTIFKIIGNPVNHPLQGIYTKEYSTETKDALKEILPHYYQVIERLKDVRDLVNNLIDIQISFTREEIQETYSLIDAIRKVPRFSSDILAFVAEKGNIERTITSITEGRERDQFKQEILTKCTHQFLEENSFLLQKEWDTIQQKWFLPRFFASRKFLKKLRIYAPTLSEEEISPLLEKFNLWNEKREFVEKQDLSSTFKDIAKCNDENWDAIETTLKEVPEIMDAISSLAVLHQHEVMSTVRHLLDKADNQWTIFKKSTSQSLENAYNILTELQETDTSLHVYAETEVDNQDLSYPTTQQIDRWIQHLDSLRDWQLWCTRKKQLEAKGLGFVIEAIVNSQLPAERVAQQMAKGIYHTLAGQIIDSDNELNQFNGLIFEKQIEKYRNLANEFQELTKKELYCRLASKIPSMSMEASSSSEVGILKKNIHNGGRGISIRKIMDLTPTLLPQLCPCMLMSPLSVAQYIDLDQNKFDLVIFDEASQMPTSEAVGAIARGKSLIVVGDPKQMPPTSFFSSNKIEEEEAYIDDLDSILDDCIALSIPSRYLTWHYRSKHESLIAFSNSQYYDGKLYTFPSVDDRSSKVTLVPITGVYDKGKTRSNRAEAEAIVKEVIRRLSDTELSKYSIGIIAFSSVQQNLIEDLLTDTLAANVELEEKAYQREEPIFIKNLENVQGDERDIILFSIGYGPDKNGKVSMNFGPLNNKGGERRLNVAVSRARYEMMIFSSLKSEQIDLKRTQAQGVEGLKKFLEFAERGNLSVTSTQRKEENQIGLLDNIAKELRQRGYTIDTNVGRSNFKIDLAIVSPKAPDQYILGILCDGINFYQTNTMRDREIVQPNVLKMLHWNIFRIWSVDWFEHKETVLNKIDEVIKELLSNQPDVESHSEKPKITTFKDELKQATSVEIINDKEQTYQFANLPVLSGTHTIDEILDSYSKVSDQIDQILSTEQPITNTLMYKRIVQLWGLGRSTPRIQKLIDGILESYYQDSYILNNIKTYWKDELTFKTYTTYRVNSNRDILDIPLSEVVNAMIYIIEQQISIPKEDYKRVTSQVLGFSHYGRNIDLVTEKALSILLGQNILCIKNEMITKAEDGDMLETK